MLKLMEFVLLAVALAVVLGLIVAGRPEAPPIEDHPAGARDSAEGRHPKAS